MAAFAQFGSELDAKTQAQIDRGKRIIEIFKQPQYNPIPVEVQVAVIWAVQNHYVDDPGLFTRRFGKVKVHRVIPGV